MNSSVLIEMIGYVGSALVLISFLMTSVVKLRVINAIGGTIFAVYAMIIHSYPTMIMNICLVLINLYYLWKLRNSEPNYRMICLKPTDGFIDAFLQRHSEDVASCFPGRTWDARTLNRAYLICHGDEAAGILMGSEENGVLNIALDYTTPSFRDASVGNYLVDHLPAEGIHTLRYTGAEPKHVGFLKKMGYVESNGVHEKTL